MIPNRFPKPDFESGYQYPDITYAVPHEAWWTAADLVVLVVLMSIVAWAVIKRQTRRPILWVSLVSVGYFGFFRGGCVCSVGSIQNVALALTDSNYVLPVSVLLFFLLPLLFAFLFGRVFCGGVCPFGALQELVNVKHVRLPAALTTVLGMIPWLYLLFALLYAVTRSDFLICRFDPFVPIFRLGGDMGMIVFGVALLVMSVFIGRPFCRFLCPYGVLLGLFASVSWRRVKITKKECINCELCHRACPVDAIRPPYANKVKETRAQGVRRILGYALLLPVLMLAGALLMRSASSDLSRANKEVRLFDLTVQHPDPEETTLPVELEAYYGAGGTPEAAAARNVAIQADFRRYATIAGALIGLVIGWMQLHLSTKRGRRKYEIEASSCVACGRCFGYCPQNRS
ncbi:MAG: 4Fe-4S binding protein [Prevotellaceae bacterium]|jgi:ferredoxin|nr:4Fe-4S binding protein [Prevotellaceae bacterium]